MADKIDEKTIEEIRRLGLLFQEKERQSLEAEETLRLFVFKVIENCYMWNDANAIRDMIQRVPPTYTRFKLFDRLHELEKQQKSNDSCMSNKMDEEMKNEIQRLGQLYREREQEESEVEEKLRRVVFNIMDSHHIWSDLNGFTEMMHLLPSCSISYDLIPKFVELKKSQSNK